MSKRTATRLGVLAVIPLTMALLTACCAEVPDASAKQSSSATSEEITSLDDWRLALAKCLRAEGLDMPDPDSGRNFKLDESMSDAFDAAVKKCRGKLGDPPPAAGEEKMSTEERAEERRKAAQCFRDHGFDVADPKEGEATGLPADLPDDILKACLSDGATTSKGR